jgi:hypothetical protein
LFCLHLQVKKKPIAFLLKGFFHLNESILIGQPPFLL